MHPREQAVQKVHAMADAHARGDFEEVVQYPDGRLEALLARNGVLHRVFSIGPKHATSFNAELVLELLDEGDEPPTEGQMQQIRALGLPEPRTREGAHALLFFYSAYASAYKRWHEPPTEGQIQQLRWRGYVGPTPRTRREAKELLAALNRARQAQAA